MAAERIVICGGGIAGVAMAYELAVLRGVRNVVLLESREAPLTLTSAYSTECYRNLWSDAHMMELMNLSIDRVETMAEESDNFFRMTRRGYVYLTGDAELALKFVNAVDGINAPGGFASDALGPARLHSAADLSLLDAAYGSATDDRGARDYEGGDGVDVLLGSDTVRSVFPWVGDGVEAALHARRCGWFDAQQLGQYMLTAALDAGATLQRAQLVRVDCDAGKVVGLGIRSVSGLGESEADFGPMETMEATHLVNAAGPYAEGVHQLLAPHLEEGTMHPLTLTNEVHAKVVFNDTRNALPSESPMMIWSDVTKLEWEEDMRAALEEVASSEESSEEEKTQMRRLLSTLPAGVHYRPLTSGDYRLLLWDFVHTEVEATLLEHDSITPFVHPDPGSSPGYDDLYTELVMRGLSSTFAPTLQPYIDEGLLGGAGVASVDGGYYTHTRDNKPVLGAVPGVEGAHICAAFSGFGVMAACGAAAVVADGIVPHPSKAASISDGAKRSFLIDRDYGAGVEEIHPALSAIGGGI